jgi:molybdenum cofactor synthesis domain-containing protein
MREVRVEDAVGSVLAHDLTKIIPGKFKGPRYKKGHIISVKDIPELLDMGKEHIYILDMKEEDMHEDDAAIALSRFLMGPNLQAEGPREGKVGIKATIRGLFSAVAEPIHAVNSLQKVAVATLHNNTVVNPGEMVAGTRAIPLVISRDIINTAKEILSFSRPVLEVKPFKPLKAGVVTTGNEIFYGRIKDKFAPVIEKKLQEYGGSVEVHNYAPDDILSIKENILRLQDKGLDLIILTGGMSVDPDDRTPGAVKESGADLVAYGTPVLPGSMFLVAYLEGTPVLGLPGCVMYEKTTVFDLILPQIFAGVAIKKEDIFTMGVGGLCRSCPQCSFPRCSFGKR